MFFRLYSNHKLLIRNIFWRALYVFSKQGVIFLIFILSAKFLSPFDFGIYNYLLTIILFLVMFGDFGISTAASKQVAECIGNEYEKDKIGSIVFNSSLIIFILATVITLFVLLLGRNFFGNRYLLILNLLPLVFLIPLTSLFDGLFRGLKLFKKAAIISLINALLLLFYVYPLIKGYGLYGAIITQNIFYFVLLISSILNFKEIKYKINKSLMNSVAKYSLLVGFADLGIFLYVQSDILILGHFNFINEIAYLSVANKFFMLLALPFSILGQVIAPDITQMYQNKKFSEILLKLKKYFKFSIMVGGVILIIGFLSINPIIKLFLQPYDNETFFLFFKMLMIIVPIRIFGTILASSFIISTGNAQIMTYNNLIFGGLNLVLDLIFIKIFGSVGVIYSTVILGYISVLIAYVFFIKSIMAKKYEIQT